MTPDEDSCQEFPKKHGPLPLPDDCLNLQA